jgi:hypothetical protein
LELIMAIRVGLNPRVPEHARELRTRLAQELGGQETAGQPIVYLEPTLEAPTRVVVVWDEWRELSLEDRSRIILDAYHDASGDEAMLRIVVAMGLTSPEAERMGIPTT